MSETGRETPDSGVSLPVFSFREILSYLMPDKGQDGFLSGRIMTFRRKAEAEAGLHGVVQNMHGLYQILFNIVVFLCKKIGKDSRKVLVFYNEVQRGFPGEEGMLLVFEKALHAIVR